MKETKIERAARLFSRLAEMGFTYSEAQSLRRIEMTLHRWAEAECNGEIKRNEKSGVPLRYIGGNYIDPHDFRQFQAIPDREAGALKRLAKIMAIHPKYLSYHQTDPSGCALYIVAKADLRGQPIDQVYSRGLAVCI